MPAELFKWEQRSLDALAVYYAGKYQFDKQRDSETLAHAICKEASELFCEQILLPAAVMVSSVDECYFEQWKVFTECDRESRRRANFG